MFVSSSPRIPLVKHKSMREALREKGIHLPYQDPALKYQTEFAVSTTMNINNYADVCMKPLVKATTAASGTALNFKPHTNTL